MNNIYNYSIEELNVYFESIGEKSFRSIQIYEWLYKHRINDFDEIQNMKKEVIEKLKQDFNLNKLSIIKKLEGQDVYKYLFKLNDGNTIEAVLMKHPYGNSLCISTQVGCNMGCHFCESGKLKKVRNLDAGEMVLQILQIEEDLKIRISHVVIMGIGEPFDNYDNVIKFINIINHPKGINIGARHITVSTSGLIPKIEKFIEDGKQVNLAISLHAPNDELRNKLMPINKVYNISKLMEIIKKYITVTNRRVTIEYIMLNGINDKTKHAQELAQLLKGVNCYVNLIPYNETSNSKFKKSDKQTIMKFYDILKKNKINVTIRKEFGTNVMAACGQLSANANYKEDQ
ncbi:MAG: 23S rRNA (adenine(2503)-C(2))-methyltransferase RlmN [Mollicutes bacterium]|jgi:23S rRNA (adenine2503-C2)-methyltransferase|nr:23S rRNA (adenine(2503)-C(2))-methyltransferase RlmN [Mollicutes bacterium]